MHGESAPLFSYAYASERQVPDRKRTYSKPYHAERRASASSDLREYHSGCRRVTIICYFTVLKNAGKGSVVKYKLHELGLDLIWFELVTASILPARVRSHDDPPLPVCLANPLEDLGDSRCSTYPSATHTWFSLQNDGERAE